MSKSIILTTEFVDAEGVMPVEGDAADYTKPSVYDIPTEIDVSAGDAGEVVLRFVYPDREEATAEAPLDDAPNLVVTRGRYSGKLMALRARDGLPAVVDRLRASAGRQRRKNQELNFLLVSNILREKQAELQPV